MKKILGLIIIAGAAAIVLPSCKKDWTCVCTDSSNNKTYEFEVSDARKPEAKLTCERFTWGDNCKLK
ncbi:hypothetical protein [Taibaiella helva]|uniref:hypothetical protein n=1 Tax=Taibaiella helva TaxID=2301235 RepID=UPI000E56DDC0|nr:hypothetical protein [Taibaiella helva]